MNVLIETSLFPEKDVKNHTNVTEFTARTAENLAKEGNNVVVIYHKCIYPRTLIFLFKLLSKVYKKEGLLSFLSQYTRTKNNKYEENGYIVIRKRILKIFPKTLYTKTQIKKHARSDEKTLKEINFSPDIVYGDFINPALFVAQEMNFDKKIPIIPGLHNMDLLYLKRKFTKKRTENALKKENCAIFHSHTKMRTFDKEHFKIERKIFVPLGVRDEDMPSECEFKNKVKNFIFIGNLNRNKQADKVIKAFGKLQRDDISLTIIGKGFMEEELKKLAKEQKNSEKIRFLGYIPQKEVLKHLENSDCQILISSPETFGMVYVEAMSRGVIPIGSKNEGIDGVIINGENGFLCEAGNDEELLEILNKMFKMGEEEIKTLSENAFKTAKKLADSVLSKELSDIFYQEMELCQKELQ